MFTRRRFVRDLLLLSGGLMMHPKAFSHKAPVTMPYRMPEEGEPHVRTWMSFVARDSIWSRRQIPEVKRNLALIATIIAKYEHVSMLVSPDDYDEAREYLEDTYGVTKGSAYPIELVPFKTDDLWLRDTGPTFVVGADGHKYGVDFNFNGWGEKQTYHHDAKVAEFITRQSAARYVSSQLTLEGGCFEVDGEGTAIMTRSCIINENRNPGISEKRIEDELKRLLGLRKIIWLDGVKGKDITDGHTDFYARFIKPGEVMVSRDNYRDSHDYEVTRENIDVLGKSRDADGRDLKLTILDTPEQINESFGVNDFAAGYIGYYLCNNAVIAQKFGDQYADSQARKALEKAFPDRTVEQISIDGIASGGGSIHCATQQETVARNSSKQQQHKSNGLTTYAR